MFLPNSSTNITKFSDFFREYVPLKYNFLSSILIRRSLKINRYRNISEQNRKKYYPSIKINPNLFTRFLMDFSLDFTIYHKITMFFFQIRYKVIYFLQFSYI